MEKEVSDRVKFVRAEKICFGSLSSGHLSMSCNIRSVCNTCNKRHPTCLQEERHKGEQKATQFGQEKNKVRPKIIQTIDTVTASTFKVNQN